MSKEAFFRSQCDKRGHECIYPSKSLRGLHKRKGYVRGAVSPTDVESSDEAYERDESV